MPLLSGALRARIAEAPDAPGCYLWKDGDGRVLYVGKAKLLRRRLASYAQRLPDLPVRLQCMLGEAAELEWLVTGSEVEALLTEALLIKELQPKYNVALKDGKTYPLLAITREPFPRVFITRDRHVPNADLLGPFPSAGDLQRATHFLQRVFRFRTCDLDLREDDPARRSFTPCLNWHIKRCSAPCTTRISAAEYAADIRALRAFVAGRGRRELVAELAARMKEAARELRFEDAARIRDQIHAIERLSERGRLADYREPPAPVLDAAAGLAALQRHLGLPAPPRVIEGFDIAHIQGRFVVAGLVQFVGGVPHKDGYRRFRVKGALSSPRNDDYAAMHEVVARRYRRVRDEGRALPDLVLIDGGAGQLRAALQALQDEGIALPALIAIAKRDETIVLPNDGELRLPRRDPGLRLLQYVRDEAHRFCRRYFHLLQRQALEETVGEG